MSSKEPKQSFNKLTGNIRLLVFDIGNLTLSTPVDTIRTILDFEELDESGASGYDGLQIIDLHDFLLIDVQKLNDKERKLIILKSKGKYLQGIIVDRIHGVGSFTELYPIPHGVFAIPDGILTHVIATEDPWLILINLEKAAEMFSFQPVEVKND